jgi:uncharacterized protein with NAD-binding domain and iron-sulfur cluster
MSSLAAVFALTSLPGWKERYAFTIYQHGFRLGGKCASGRNLEMDGRIEEHGLHLFFGWYENVFRILRQTYTDLTGDPDAWKASFIKFDGAVVMHEEVGGSWPIECPHDDDVPGDGRPVDMHPWTLARKAIEWALAQLRADGLAMAATGHPVAAHLDTLPADRLSLSTAQLEQLRDLVDQTHADVHAPDAASLSNTARRTRILVSMALAMGRGLIHDLLLKGTTDWFTLDQYDLRQWLRAHGASEETLQSAPVFALYDAAFSAYSTLGAGTIVQALLRAAFTWRGSAIWRINGGMGDLVFSPLYRVLKKRGVDFKFFHRVEALELSSDGRNVQRIRIDEQVKTKNGAPYQPLVSLPGDAGPPVMWPTKPDVTQLDVDPGQLDGHDLESWWDPWRGSTLVLERGTHFDSVLLGISVAALNDICSEMVADLRNPRFGDMVRGVVTTQTRALQVWMNRPPQALGWDGECTIPFEEPYDTACQMNHLIALEPYSIRNGVQTIAYACSPLDDDEPPAPRSDSQYPKRQHDRAVSQARDWLQGDATKIWPSASVGGAFDWSALVDPNGAQGPARLAAQYVNTPTNPSDRYVLMAQGSNRFRLRPGESGYDNLTLTGDWTKSALSGGFLEAAAMAGIDAARTIDPSVPKAVGDWLPDPAPAPAAPRTFIERDGDLVAKPPLDLDMQLYVFLLRADTAALQRLLDQQLNWGPEHYRPLGPFVALYVSSLDIMAPPFAVVPAKDFGFWVPALAGKKVGNTFLPNRLVTYTPYLWADGGWALIGGREVFGFPKQLGSVMSMPAQPGAPGSFQLQTMVLPSAGATATISELFSIERTDSSIVAAPHDGRFTKPSDVGGAAESWLKGRLDGALSAIDGGLLRLTSMTSMTMVFVKQFPDPTAGAGACYRAIVEAPMEPVSSRVEGGLLAGTYEVAIRRYASHQIASTLGLSGTTPGAGVDRVAPMGQVWMKTVVRLQPGRVVADAMPRTPPVAAATDRDQQPAWDVTVWGRLIVKRAGERLDGLARRFGFGRSQRP